MNLARKLHKPPTSSNMSRVVPNSLPGLVCAFFSMIVLEACSNDVTSVCIAPVRETDVNSAGGTRDSSDAVGTIVETGPGFSDRTNIPFNADPAEYSFIVVQGQDVWWSASAKEDFSALGLSMGTEVTMSSRAQSFGLIAAPISQMSIRVDGQLVFHHARSGRLEDLALPAPLSVRYAGGACVFEPAPCERMLVRELAFTDGDDAITLVPDGAPRRIGDLIVRVHRATEDASDCGPADWYGTQNEVTVTKATR